MRSISSRSRKSLGVGAGAGRETAARFSGGAPDWMKMEMGWGC